MSSDDQKLMTARQQAESLTIFRGVLADEVGRSFLALVDELISERRDPNSAAAAYGHLFGLLAEEAELYQGEPFGDAWQNHLLDRIAADQNAFSLKAEHAMWEAMGTSLVAAVRFDLRSLQSLFLLDARLMCRAVERTLEGDGTAGSGPLPNWSAFRGLARRSGVDGHLAELKHKLVGSDNWGDLAKDLAAYYREAGAGIFGSYHAFRWIQRNGKGQLEGIANPDTVRLEDIIGYEAERELLVQNTAHFLAGYPANNALLYGDRGTGKSSTVKALLNEYGSQGLRLVEVSKQHLDDFPQILALLRNRRERFVLFIDDLSFEDNETHYKELKAVLEGSLEARPENVLLYATSNRRHLIRERFADRTEGLVEEVHPGDTLEEKLSLSDRFGITLTFLAPNQERYLTIVSGLARQRNITISPEDLEFRALRWAVQHNGRSGRTARQFIDFLSGELRVSPTVP